MPAETESPSSDSNRLQPLINPVMAKLRPDIKVREAVEQLRRLVPEHLFTYAYATGENDRLLGVLVMRDLLFADPEASVSSVMIPGPFFLTRDMPMEEAFQEALHRHYPEYPVCDSNGTLLGVVRGEALFREQTIHVSAQMGTSVGVEKEERLSTPILRSLKFRYPWLQINLFTAFLAAGVVSMFQGTIEKVVVLAAFLPVLAGQSGNTGCQALAVALRGLTLGDFGPGEERRVMIKEGILGLLNGTLVGIVAGIGMYIFASLQGATNGITLAFIVLAAMVGSCTISGVAGAFIPLALKRLGADPATASSIFVTTATDIGSMGLFLALAAHFAL